MEDIQSWYEVPSIAHFCSLFRAAFCLVDFDIEELEEALLTDGAEDMGSSLIQDLIVRLLNGCLSTNEVTSSNYQMFLRRLFRQKFHEDKTKNPFNSDVDFRFLPLRTKVEILHFLCDCRLEAEDVLEVLKNLEADSLRVEPLGYDDFKAAYWYFYGTRLYKEENALDTSIDEDETTDKPIKKGKKKTVKENVRGPWTVACFTEEDWQELCQSLANATSRNEKILYRTLKEDFLPEIPNLFAEKERQQRKRLSDFAPRRASTRIEKLKMQKEEQERIVAVAIQTEILHAESSTMETDKRSPGIQDGGESDNKSTPTAPAKPKAKKIDEDEWMMLRNKADRATRALLREISRDNVDLFTSFDSTPNRSCSGDSFAISLDKLDATLDKAPKKETGSKHEKGESQHPAPKPLKQRQETENKPSKPKSLMERSDKNVVEGGKTSRSSENDSTVTKSAPKKGRQTNNSLSSVIDPNTISQLENGVKYRRVSPSLSSDEAKIGMYKILEQIKNHPDAWPFLDPVDEDFAPDYYTKISQPMDLEKMEQRVSSKYYQSVNEFMSDFDLIVENCKKYNGPESEYSCMVDSLSEEFRVLTSRYLNSVYEREPDESGSDSDDCSTASDESSQPKRRKPSVPDAKKKGGLMKLAQAFSGSRNRSNSKQITAASKVKLKTEDVYGETPSPDSSETEVKYKKSSKLKDNKADKKKLVNKKPVGGRNLEAINALAAATEQTLKDMNKWLVDTPKFSEFSSVSGNSSPNDKVTAEEFETLSTSVEEEYRKQKRGKSSDLSPSKSLKKNKSMQHKKKGLLILASKGRLPIESKLELEEKRKKKRKKEKKEKLMESLFESPTEKASEKETSQSPLENGKSNSNAVKDKDRSARTKTLDRLQSGGKSKLPKVSRPDESKLSSVIARIKESRSSALQKQTETIQKAQLSLGTVLFSEIGSKTLADTSDKEANQVRDSSFLSSKKEKEEEEEEEVENKKKTQNKEEEPSPSKEDEPAPVPVGKHSATPNLSAWFKAFGAPKNPIKRQVSETQELKHQPPIKKAFTQIQPQQTQPHHLENIKPDLPWYARLEKKEPSSSSTSSSIPPVIKETQDKVEESKNSVDPSSPSDSMGSLNSPASAESIKSPSTPVGGWSNRYSSANDGMTAVRSPLTPETASFSPSMVAPHPIKVGFYQDMQALKGASPGHVVSPSCHSNSSSGTGPNSPNDHNLSQNEPVRAPLPVEQSQHHHHTQQQQQHPSSQQPQRPFQLDQSSHVGGSECLQKQPQPESYPLKKRSTSAVTHSPSPSIITPTPIHANRPGSGPPPAMHDHHQRATPLGAPPGHYGSFNSSDYRSFDESARHSSSVPQHHQQQQQAPPAELPPNSQYGHSSYPHYGQHMAPAKPLPGNLASLSQIVARIPTTTAVPSPAVSSTPIMSHIGDAQHSQQQLQQQQPPSRQPQQQQQPSSKRGHVQPQQQQQQQQQQPQQQGVFNPMTTPNMGYSYPFQPAFTPTSSSPGFSGTPQISGSTTSSSAPSGRSSGENSSIQNSSSHIMAYGNPTVYGGQPPPGVFYPQAQATYRSQPVQQQQQPPQVQSQGQQQSSQQHQQNRPNQMYAEAPLNSFEPSNYIWNSRPEHEVQGNNAGATSSSSASTPYGRSSSSSGSSPFPSNIGYDPHHHHHHMGAGSLLFGGIDPLAAAAAANSASAMFSRNPLSRTSPWAPPSLDSPSAISGRGQEQQPQPVAQPTTASGRSRSKRGSAASAAAANAAAASVSSSVSAVASGSAFNYNVQGLAPSSVPGSDPSRGLYDRHRVTSGQSAAPPPPAHQGSSAHHQYAPAPGSHHPFSSSAPGLNPMTSSYADYGQPPHPHHPLADHAQSSVLYQQFLQQTRQHQEELLLRNQHPLLHQPGLLGTPAAYPATFSSGLSLQQPFPQGWL